MTPHLFAIAGVDAHGKHTFIKRDPFSKGLTTAYNPADAVYVGRDQDIDKLINECERTFDVSQSINYIPYTVKSNITSIELFDSHNIKRGEYTVH